MIRDTHEETGTQELDTLESFDETPSPEPGLVDSEPSDMDSAQELPLLPGDDRINKCYFSVQYAEHICFSFFRLFCSHMTLRTSILRSVVTGYGWAVLRFLDFHRIAYPC